MGQIWTEENEPPSSNSGQKILFFILHNWQFRVPIVQFFFWYPGFEVFFCKFAFLVPGFSPSQAQFLLGGGRGQPEAFFQQAFFRSLSWTPKERGR